MGSQNQCTPSRVFLEKTKGVAFEALESQSRYPSIVPRYKEKVESNLLDEMRVLKDFYGLLRIWNVTEQAICNQSLARSIHVFRQCLARIGFLDFRNLIGGSLGNDAPTIFSAFGPQIYDPISIANDIEIVFNDDH